MTWVRDSILILAAIGLIIAVLWPDSEKTSLLSDKEREAVVLQKSNPRVQPVATPKIIPMMNVSHRLFPLVEGGCWRYLVTGTKELIPETSWSMEIVKMPTDATPGEIRMGFGDQLVSRRVWLQEDAVHMDDLPFSAPLRFLGTEITQWQGAWIPRLKYVIEDAVWNYQLTRQVMYRSRGERNQITEEPAIATQTDRALVKAKEKIIVPAGVFDAYHVQWTSRMEIVTQKKKRKVLQELTVEPYKTESTWFAPGIGMVRRRVMYNSNNQEDIIFDLVSFSRPNMESR